MLSRLIIVLLLSPLFLSGQESELTSKLNFSDLIQLIPEKAKFADDHYFIWGGSLVKDDTGLYHLYYSRWEKKYGFGSWVTHSEIAHATASTPFGPFTHKDVALPPRDSVMWDGKSTHNPTIHKLGSKYYLYYTGNTGDRKCTQGLNFTHRNNQRIGVAVASDPNGPWLRSDKPLIDISDDTGAHDALMVSNPSVTMMPDSTFLLVYKAVGKMRPMPFGGPVVHLTATSRKPEGPFAKQMKPVFVTAESDFPAEDPFIWFQRGVYYAIVKDMHGHFTQRGRSLALFESKDGFSWNVSENTLVSDLMVRWENGRSERMSHLERPQIFFENGVPLVLLVATDHEENGLIRSSCNIQIPLKRLK